MATDREKGNRDCTNPTRGRPGTPWLSKARLTMSETKSALRRADDPMFPDRDARNQWITKNGDHRWPGNPMHALLRSTVTPTPGVPSLHRNADIFD